ncbi:phage integrase N-terminal SAM-like domain-containing protein [Photobacterium phosphoreum]|uniref:phage integrase N-terminal SAM-like domain-containing protein n=1 Tax=Photobacterium phosphoreum TaxID=659 RepID=UPI000D15CAA7|nr:phage integrase N-terminal SAM-like domain-containing protein [Photobacterium phosphoreum]
MNNEQQQRSDYLYEQHVTHLTLQGKRPALLMVRRITHHLDKSPDTLTTDDLKRYFAQLIKTYSWSTVRINHNELRKLWMSYLLPSLTACQNGTKLVSV